MRRSAGAHHGIRVRELLYANWEYGRSPLERAVITAMKSVHRTRLGATDRRKQLIFIAMNHIATKGFEGLRFQDVAKEAGINNGTLCYHFPTKEALIQGVGATLFNEVKKTRGHRNNKLATARDELRVEFSDLRELLRRHPELFIVLTELSLRGLRDPAIGKMEESRDGFWRKHLSGIIRRGVEQGVFRRDIRVEPVVTALMAQFKGIGYHSSLGKREGRETDVAIAEIARQVEHWLTCG
jgi:AcrR family transcriptional regulator